MNRRAKLPDVRGLGTWDPSCRHTYCEEKAGNHTNRALSSPLKKQVCRLKGQEGPHRLASPDMFESNDYLRFSLEHPRQTAFVRVFVEDDLASTGTPFKFNFECFAETEKDQTNHSTN
ncbi:hypothetical protein FVEG_16541 [Fusarium verticillioides 7600]|uniref:Uncharacterized protein n=1 Tax=Gibberella moniliformis (strain M3125 / FGSC 7600) TaxID=334819 RepID=W7MQ13_GIBM7|nr:hypothetical protein FVEG_16541 [Fusarium verticillioides 7600]EWG49854.1 hypothetical protein FVEG_16541 [Fusarium verticillioides 7600]